MFIRFSGPVLAAIMAVACSSASSNSTAPGDGGASSQKLPVGSPCMADSDCGTAPFMCMMGDHPGGYCMRDCDISKGDADCPSEAICQFDGMTGECHKKCSSQSDCRTGYVCAPASSAADDMASHAFCDVAPAAGDAGGDGG